MDKKARNAANLKENIPKKLMIAPTSQFAPNRNPVRAVVALAKTKTWRYLGRHPKGHPWWSARRARLWSSWLATRTRTLKGCQSHIRHLWLSLRRALQCSSSRVISPKMTSNRLFGRWEKIRRNGWCRTSSSVRGASLDRACPSGILHLWIAETQRSPRICHPYVTAIR